MNLQNIQILFLLLDSVIMLTPWRTMNMDKMIGKDFETGPFQAQPFQAQPCQTQKACREIRRVAVDAVKTLPVTNITQGASDADQSLSVL